MDRTPEGIMAHGLWNIAHGVQDPKAAADATLKEAGKPHPSAPEFADRVPLEPSAAEAE